MTADIAPAHNGQPRTERQIDTAERDAQAARLRHYGFSYRQIAKQMGWESPASAHRAVGRALREIIREAAEDLVKLETERFDAALAPVLRIIETGTPLEQLAAVDRLVKLSESRRKLLGLDAPTRTDLRITDSLDAQLEQLASEVAALEAPVGAVRED